MAEKGRELYIIGRAKGLYDFWNELIRSPIPEGNNDLITNLFPKLANEKDWNLAKQYAERTNLYLTQPQTKVNSLTDNYQT